MCGTAHDRTYWSTKHLTRLCRNRRIEQTEMSLKGLVEKG
jgi:hypothetical protein